MMTFMMCPLLQELWPLHLENYMVFFTIGENAKRLNAKRLVKPIKVQWLVSSKANKDTKTSKI